MARALRIFGVLLVILLLLIVAGFIYLRFSLPRTRGSVQLPGLSAQVEVLRDRHAVPHIYARTLDDAYFALGFVHAQDRLWQMEMQRRVGAGRLSEVLGEATLETDRFLRTLGVYRAAEATFANFEPETQALIEAYISGINAHLATRRGPLPPEFLLLRFEPEPWTPADVIVWAKMMAWDLGGNWDDELLRAKLLRDLSPEQVSELWPPYPGDAPVVLPGFRALYRELDLDGLLAAMPKPLPPGAGSNNWVLGPEKSANGAPLLANDPHLGLQAPSLWYFAHLSAPGLELIGATLPGTPGVLLGRNDRVAWGFTNTGSDTQDFFIERLNPENAGEYETPDGFAEFEIYRETIKVRGQEGLELIVRESRHGPIISDVSSNAARVAGDAGEASVLALAWPTLRADDLTLQAVINMGQAQTWDDFVSALEDFHSPQQNMVYGDVDGNIGFIAPARVPVRPEGQGLVPVPGWTGDYDWGGFIPFEDLPQTFNPAGAQIVTANHKIVPEDYPYLLTTDWTSPYRALRIQELLAQLGTHSLESFARIQADQHSGFAADILPFFLDAQPETQQARRMQARLVGWDAGMDRARAEPLIFWGWYRELGRLIYGDELGDQFDAYEGFRPLFVLKTLEDDAVWCDDVRTASEETCDLQINRALQNAATSLTEAYGDDIGNWRWGEAHYAEMDHRPFSNVPYLKPFFELAVPNGGDAFTVNAASFRIGSDDEPFKQHWAPGYRALYDLSDLNASRYIHSTGQSGNPLSRHYRNFLQPWRDTEYLSMTTDRSVLERQKVGTLRLNPR